MSDAREQRKIAMSIRHVADGDYELVEHDLAGREREDRVVARFYRDIRIVTTMSDGFGPGLAQQDMAMVRAHVFADFFERLVNSGKIDFG